VRLHVYYGGSFDPVHRGHLAIACAVRDALDARVWLVPAADPPHKTNTFAPSEARAALLDLAVAGQAGLHVDRSELQRAGPSYTVDTLRGLRAAAGAAQPIAWLVGGDSLRQLDRWHDWRGLFEVGHVLAVERPGRAIDLEALERDCPDLHRELALRWRQAGALRDSPSGGYAGLALPRLQQESSTQVRARIAEDGAWQALVPEPVARHIEQHGLYGARPRAPGSL
jgi:nicotinate-nucleotide adenylyltransferase